MTPIALTLSGSSAHGTTHADSDVDLRGIHLPSPAAILDGRARDETSIRGPGPDQESYTLRFFLGMCVRGSPLAIEMLSSPDAMQQMPMTEVWGDLRANRERLFCRKTLFQQYADTQRNRYLRVATNLRTLREMDKLLGQRAGMVRDWFDDLLDIGGVSRCKQGVVGAGLTLHRDLATGSAKGLVEAKMATYGQKGIAAADTDGTDRKSQMHALRLLQEGIELHRTGAITLPRPNAAELLDLRFGDVPAEELARRLSMAEADYADAECESVLRAQPDLAWMERFLLSHYRDHVNSLTLDAPSPSITW